MLSVITQVIILTKNSMTILYIRILGYDFSSMRTCYAALYNPYFHCFFKTSNSGIFSSNTPYSGMFLRGMFVFFRNVKLFIKLCFIDTACPHNYLFISNIQSQADRLNFYEAFFEAGPQLLVLLPYAVFNLVDHGTMSISFDKKKLSPFNQIIYMSTVPVIVVVSKPRLN